MTLRFGIITPTYNRCAKLQRAIASVVDQDHRAWVQYVVDDAMVLRPDCTGAWRKRRIELDITAPDGTLIRG